MNKPDYIQSEEERLEELLDRYGFKEPDPVVDTRKFKVSFAGRDAIMTYSELCNFSRELGPNFYPIIEEIKGE